MLRLAGLLFGILLASSAIAQDREKLLGLWKLTSFDVEYQASGEKKSLYGAGAKGYLIFTPQARMIALLTAEGRKPAKTNDERSALLGSMIAYSGLYRLEGDRFITKVDTSWNESWNGTEQVRFYKVIDDRLDIVSAWGPSVVDPSQAIVRGILTWERVRSD